MQSSFSSERMGQSDERRKLLWYQFDCSCQPSECVVFYFTFQGRRSNFNNRRIHTQERLRFPSRLKYRDFLRLSRQAEISRLLPSGIILLTELRMTHIKQEYTLSLFWYARLEWWDRKYQDYLLKRLTHICRDANNRKTSCNLQRDADRDN